MKKGQKLVTILVLIMIYIVLLPTCILPFFSRYYTYIINPIFWTLLAILTYHFYKKVKIKNKYNRYFAKLTFYISLAFIILVFLSGFVFGFTPTSYDNSLVGIIKNIYCFVVVLLLQEYIRYYLINSVRRKTKVYFLITLIFTLFDLALTFRLTTYSILNHILITTIPTFSVNALCSYLAYKKSLYSSFIVKAVLTTTFLLVPVIPNFKTSIFIILELLYYLAIYLSIARANKNLSDVDNKIKINKNKGLKYTVLTIVTIIVSFIIGVFYFAPLAISNDLMEPNLSFGDMAIYKKVNDISIFRPDDVIVYVKDKKLTVKRIESMTSRNGKIYIQTKGDKPNTLSDYLITKEDIIGLYQFKIPYAGYPSAIIYKLLGRV